jgi:hypothetical protein
MEPATFRHVEQYLNELRYRMPPVQAVSTFTYLVLYHLGFCSIIQTTKLNIFVQSGNLNWYMQHHSLAQGGTLLSAEI